MAKTDFQAVLFKDDAHLWVLTEHKYHLKGEVNKESKSIITVDLHSYERGDELKCTTLLKRSLLTEGAEGRPFIVEVNREKMGSFLANCSYFNCDPALPELVGLNAPYSVIILDLESASVLRTQTFDIKIAVGIDAIAGKCVSIEKDLGQLSVSKYHVRNFSHELRMARVQKERLVK